MIFISKEGILTREYNSDTKKFDDTLVESIAVCLNQEVSLSKDLTFMDLFSILEKEKSLINVLFMSQLGGFDFNLYLDDIKKPISKKEKIEEDENNEIHYLELRWVAESTTYENDSEENDINIYPDFHGWGRWIDESSGEPIDGGVAIEFTPLRLLKDFKIKLNNKFEIYNTIFFEKPDKDGKELETEIILESYRSFSVYDLISTILFEISFLGPPEDRDEAFEELLESSEKYKNEFGDLYDHDEVKKSIKNKIFGTDMEAKDE